MARKRRKRTGTDTATDRESLKTLIRQLVAELKVPDGSGIRPTRQAQAGRPVQPARALPIPAVRTTYRAVKAAGVAATVKRLSPRLQEVYQVVAKAGRKGLSSPDIETACRINRNAVSGAVFQLRQIGLLTNE